MRYKQIYNLTFYSKEEFLKWIEKYGDKFEWNKGVGLEWYYKEEDAETANNYEKKNY